jgi:hypothetical protein
MLLHKIHGWRIWREKYDLCPYRRAKFSEFAYRMEARTVYHQDKPSLRIATKQLLDDVLEHGVEPRRARDSRTRSRVYAEMNWCMTSRLNLLSEPAHFRWEPILSVVKCK